MWMYRINGGIVKKNGMFLRKRSRTREAMQPIIEE